MRDRLFIASCFILAVWTFWLLALLIDSTP